MEQRTHVKMFKKGKNWCYMAIATIAMAFGIATTTVANADVATDQNTVTTSQQIQSDAVQSAVPAAATDSSAANSESTVSSESTEVASEASTSAASEATVTSASTSYALAATQPAQLNGWQEQDGNVYYYNNGQKATGVQNINGANYYFNDEGQQQKDYFLNQNNHTYYFQKDGTRLDDGFYTNWGHTYYFQKDGARLDDGFYQNWGHTYYFQKDGARLDNGFYTNWGHTYYFQNDGARLDNGFYKNWGHTYYFGNDGARLDNGFYTNWGHKYYFGSDGALIQNRDITVNGTKYHADKDGVLTENTVDKKVDRALSQRGVPYVWGGNTPAGFDCSGLVQWAYGLGANYRTTYQQATLGSHHYNIFSAPKGALLFFGSDSAPYHVAISLGNGSYVHAPEPGDVVKIGYSKYFKPSFFINM